MQSLLHCLTPGVDVTAAMLGEALQRSHMRLHRVLQLTAEQAGVGYQLDVRRQSDALLPELAGGARHPLLVLPLERADPSSRGHIQEQIRHTSHLVLVTCTD
jgi:hypothetical protein